MGRACWNNFMFLFHHWVVKKGGWEGGQHISAFCGMKSRIKIHFTVKWRMTNYDKWKLWTVCGIYCAICAALCMRVDGGKWSRVDGVGWSGFMALFAMQ